MTTSLDVRCPSCGYANDGGSPQCGMCGELLGGRPGPPRDPLPVADVEPVVEHRLPRRTIAGLPEPWFYFVLGAVIAPVFGLTPILQYAGWFFGSLCHEIGHSVVAWVFGMPAFPAIRIDGHAASVHKDQVMLLALLFWAGFGYAAWHLRAHRSAAVALGVVTLAYPAVAFTDAKELLHLTGGHIGELVFATVFLWRALTGGFTHSGVERLLYAVVAWYLIGDHLHLCGGLVFSPAMREWYANHGSFGMTNDYIRVAHLVDGSLPAVAAGMLAVTMIPVPLAIWLRRLTGDY